jgi:hypothetical protein
VIIKRQILSIDTFRSSAWQIKMIWLLSELEIHNCVGFLQMSLTIKFDPETTTSPFQEHFRAQV